MGYEEKYNAALERAKERYSACSAPALLEYIFPEIKESEDEKIKHEIKVILANTDLSRFALDYTFADMIAWLEKQGEHSIYNVPSREVILAIWDLGNEWKELTNGSISTEYGTQLDYIQKHWHESEYYLREKQSEQKPAKIEQKFKVGDWIIRNAEGFKHNTYLVKEVEDYYVCEELNGRQVTFTFSDVHKNFKLWDISDANDGDVLVASDGSIFLFAGVVDCACKYYAALATDNYVNINKDPEGGYWETSRSVYPATKEQRDLFSKKMMDTGYEWNIEKKEL